MGTQQTIVIVGASLAGAKAAETLRTEGFDGRLVVIGEEADPPYERPALSKGYLRGDDERSRLAVHGEDFYDTHDVELRTSTQVTAIDPHAREAHVDTGERIRFDKLLLTTGATPRRLDVAGADLAGVHYLRTVGDAERLREAIRAATRVVVVGAGWIGCEVAASARQMGAEVALLEAASVPLERVLGHEVGAVYRDLHADHGVELHLSTAVAGMVGGTHVAGVRTGTGHVVEGDVVLVGVGVTPRVELAVGAGLAVSDGVLVDEHLRSSAEEIYAAGDVANAWHPLLDARVRVEHWANALNQGPAAARSMLGDSTPYDRLPYFFSDQYDLGMEYSGFATTWDDVVFRGNPSTREFIAFWIRNRCVVAGMNVNVWDVAERIQELIRSGCPVDPQQLEDPDVPLAELTTAPAV